MGSERRMRSSALFQVRRRARNTTADPQRVVLCREGMQQLQHGATAALQPRLSMMSLSLNTSAADPVAHIENTPGYDRCGCSRGDPVHGEAAAEEHRQPLIDHDQSLPVRAPR